MKIKVSSLKKLIREQEDETESSSHGQSQYEFRTQIVDLLKKNSSLLANEDVRNIVLELIDTLLTHLVDVKPIATMSDSEKQMKSLLTKLFQRFKEQENKEKELKLSSMDEKKQLKEAVNKQELVNQLRANLIDALSSIPVNDNTADEIQLVLSGMVEGIQLLKSSLSALKPSPTPEEQMKFLKDMFMKMANKSSAIVTNLSPEQSPSL